MKLLLLLFLCVVGTLAGDVVNVINILIFYRTLILSFDIIVIFVLFLYPVLLSIPLYFRKGKKRVLFFKFRIVINSQLTLDI